jgi:hypothetical protein
LPKTAAVFAWNAGGASSNAAFVASKIGFFGTGWFFQPIHNNRFVVIH